MTDRIALLLGLLLVALAVLDAGLNGAAAATFLGRRFVALIDHLAFWR